VIAVVYERYGPPEGLRLADVPKPIPKDNELLIRVHAATVNRTDCGFLRASPSIVRLFAGLSRPKKTVLGSEFAGTIEAVGKLVTTFDVGERVFGLNGVTFGAHAEYMTIPESGLVAVIPARVSYEDAAPSSDGAHYALCAIEAAGIRAGHAVLVNGASGAIGSAAVQLLKYFGAEVTAVCGGKDIALVKALGAERVIDYTEEDFTALDDTFDVVFDAVGKSSFRRCRSLLKPGGVYLSSDLGFAAQNPFLALVTASSRGRRVLFPIPRARKEHAVLLRDLMEAGRFAAVIDRSYPLDHVIEAYHYVESGAKTGNVVLRVAEAR